MRLISEHEGKQGVKIDEKDRKILYELSRNSRQPIQVIARHVHLSRDGTAYRIQRLEQSGVLQGYKTLVDVAKFGYNSYHLFMRLHEPLRQEVIQKLIAHHHIRAILKFSGVYDWELAVIAKSFDEFMKVRREILTFLNGKVQDMSAIMITAPIVARTFPLRFFPHQKDERVRSDTEYSLDRKDTKILEIIANKANSSLLEIAAKTGGSADTVAYRLKRLRASGIIQKHMIGVNYDLLNQSMYAVLFSTKEQSAKDAAYIREVLSIDPDVLWAVQVFGSWNYLVYLCVQNTHQYQEALDRLRDQFGAQLLSFVTLLASEEFKYTYFPEGMRVSP